MLDRGALGAGASRVAAGMLAPVAEADAGGARAAGAPTCESARRWPAFAAELADVTGVDVGYRALRHALVARDRDEAEHVERERALRERARPARRAAAAAPRRGASSRRWRRRCASRSTLPDDHAVEPARVVAALRRGVHARAGVARCVRTTRRCARRSRALPAERVVVAAGAWSGALPGAACRCARSRARSLRLRDPAGPGLCERVLRFEGGYLVPRGDGRYYLGATMEERGFDTAVTALGVYELLREAPRSLPGVARARDRGAPRRACGPARPTTRPLDRRRPRRRAARLGHRPLPQRHPARARSPPTSSPTS